MNEEIEKIKAMQAAYDRNAALSDEILNTIRAGFAVSGGIVSDEVKKLYKQRDKVLKDMGKISQKINKAKKEIFE